MSWPLWEGRVDDLETKCHCLHMSTLGKRYYSESGHLGLRCHPVCLLNKQSWWHTSWCLEENTRWTWIEWNGSSSLPLSTSGTILKVEILKSVFKALDKANNRNDFVNKPNHNMDVKSLHYTSAKGEVSPPSVFWKLLVLFDKHSR